MHIFVMSKICSHLPHIDCGGLSHDKVICDNVPCEMVFLRRVIHPGAIHSAYICSLRFWHLVRYQSPMNLQQVHPTPSSSTIPFPFQSPFYFHHISDTPPFIPVPLVSPFIPTFPVSLISVSMSLWSSHLSHIVSSPRSCFSLFHTSTFVPSPWPSVRYCISYC